MTDVLATAADESYGYHVLNLVGSVKRNSNIFDRIEAFDLGLSSRQRDMLRAVPGVAVRDVPAFSPHWAQCFTWKPWAWMQVDADRVFWLDAGASVLRSLDRALEQIGELGYFLVSQGNALCDIVPPDYFEMYGLTTEYASRPYVAAGIIGFTPGGEFFDRVLVPTYQDCLAGRNLGFSADELPFKNRGLTHMESPPIRNCPHFRWDQTLLNVRLMLEIPDAAVADLDEYAGWRSRRDHPTQVIWSHRRPASLRYLTRVPYTGPRSRLRKAWGAWWWLRWRWKIRRRYLRWQRIVIKARLLRSGQ